VKPWETHVRELLLKQSYGSDLRSFGPASRSLKVAKGSVPILRRAREPLINIAVQSSSGTSQAALDGLSPPLVPSLFWAAGWVVLMVSASRSRIPVSSTTRVKSAIVFSLMIEGSGSLACRIFGRLGRQPAGRRRSQ
jgi:hypothetical protein